MESSEMRSSNAARTRRRLGKAFLIAVGLVQILAMKAGVAKDKPAIPLSVPDDWTHHHVIFSGARSQADANRLQHNPRYWHQWLRHNLQTGTGPEAAAARILNDPNYMSSLVQNVQSAAGSTKSNPGSGGTTQSQDWGTSLGAGGKVGAGMFPAKFSFDVTAAPSCANDYVAFNTSLAGSGGTAASQSGTFSSGSLQSTSTVTVDGQTFSGSPGSAASQRTTVSSNRVNAGDTITITNASSVTVTARTPTNATATLTVRTT